MIAFGEEVARKLAEVEDRDEILKTLRAERGSGVREYRAAAAALSSERKARPQSWRNSRRRRSIHWP